MSIEKPVVNIDMDGVLAGFDHKVDEIAKRDHDLDPPEFRHNFYSATNYPEEYQEAIKAATKEKGFFASLPVLDGAIHGINRVIDAGYHPRILSSPIRTNPHSEREKLEWLEEHIEPHIGSFIVAQAVITSDKHLYDGAFLIDDRPHINHSEDAVWEHVLFTQDYNKHITDKPRIEDWYDPKLIDILHVASTRSDRS